MKIRGHNTYLSKPAGEHSCRGAPKDKYCVLGSPGSKSLWEAAVKEMFRDQTGGKALRFSPFQSYAELHPAWRDVRYGICNWLEMVDIATGKILEASAPGVLGLYPWIDFGRNLVGVSVAESNRQKAFPVYLKLKALIRKEVT